MTNTDHRKFTIDYKYKTIVFHFSAANPYSSFAVIPNIKEQIKSVSLTIYNYEIKLRETLTIKINNNEYTFWLESLNEYQVIYGNHLYIYYK